jgi:hypothetical protein
MSLSPRRETAISPHLTPKLRDFSAETISVAAFRKIRAKTEEAG